MSATQDPPLMTVRPAARRRASSPHSNALSEPKMIDKVSAVPISTLADLAALRLVLTGHSVVDMGRWWFADRAAVDEFLRLVGFDVDNPLDLARIEEIHREAIMYLSEVHHQRLPEAVEHPDAIQDLFLLASHHKGRDQRMACITLKTMHIMYHIAGRELVFNLPISEAQLFARLNSRVFSVIDRMRAAGVGVVEFAAGKKTKTSLVTKLLAKRSTLASNIFDKLRFRITVNTRDDVVHALTYLLHNMIPFNYVVPDQSQNGLVTIDDLCRIFRVSPDVIQHVWGKRAMGTQLPEDVSPTPINEFSGSSYRCVNFVVDMPLRVDDIAPEQSPAGAFVAAEIQLVDVEAAKANEQGENAHSLYKKRQRQRVRERLAASFKRER